MKRLTALLFAGLVTIAPALAFEKDQFKLIPKGTIVSFYDIDQNGIYDFYWWDKNNDRYMTPNEIFLDLNQDGIPDITYEDLIEMYKLSNLISGRSI